MQRHKCGCRGRGCSACCPPKKNVAGPTGPQGVPGPTGPCCTGPTGPQGDSSETRIFMRGLLTTDEECNLALFNGQGIASLESFLVAPGVRGWRVTTVPRPCAFGPVFRPETYFGHQVFADEAGVVAEVPSVHVVQTNRVVIPLGDGTCQIQFDFALLDTTTGLPVDPCSVRLFYSVFPFINEGFDSPYTDLIADDIPSPCGPVCPPPVPGITAARNAAGPPRRPKSDWGKGW